MNNKKIIEKAKPPPKEYFRMGLSIEQNLYNEFHKFCSKNDVKKSILIRTLIIEIMGGIRK